VTDDFFEQYRGAWQPRPSTARAASLLDGMWARRYAPYTPPSSVTPARQQQALGIGTALGRRPPLSSRDTAASGPQDVGRADPPYRFSVNLLGGVMESAPGQAFLGTPGAQRGGSVQLGHLLGGSGEQSGPWTTPVATAPVNFQNFITYAREAQLSLITSALGHNYQQPTDPYGRPAGPTNEDWIGQNVVQGDFAGVLDNIIDGIATAGDAINAPFVALQDGIRSWDSWNRGQAVRDLVAEGSTPGTIIARVSSLLDQRRFSMAGIIEKAELEGRDTLSMMAELWDMPRDVVEQIAANPNMSDEQLGALVHNLPFSTDPVVSTLTELTYTLAPMLLGAAELRAASLAARGLGGGRGAIVSGALGPRGAIGSNVAGFARASGLTGTGLGRATTRVTSAVQSTGSWSMQKAWRFYSGKPFQAFGLATGVTPRGVALGGAIRAGEWMLKQTAELTGNDEAVRMLDEWLWETPLSTNPGLMLVDGFSIAATRLTRQSLAEARGAIGGAAGRVRRTPPPIEIPIEVKVAGLPDGTITVGRDTAARLAAIDELDMAPFFRVTDELGWERGWVEASYGPDAPNLAQRDLANGLLHVAAEVVRDAHEAVAARIAGATMVERAEAFWTRYGDEATKLLTDALGGSTEAIATLRKAIVSEFHTRARSIDASDLGAEVAGFVGPYQPASSFRNFGMWIRMSKLAQELHSDASLVVPALREDVNASFVTAFIKRLETAYTDPKALVDAADLQMLVDYFPGVVRLERRLRPNSRTVPRITQKSLVRTLNAALEHQEAQAFRDAEPRTFAAPIAPEKVGDLNAISKALNIPVAVVKRLARVMEEGPPETPLPDGLAQLAHRLFGNQLEEIRRSPQMFWQKLAEWAETQTAGAVERGAAIAQLDRLDRVLKRRFTDADAGRDRVAIEQVKQNITEVPSRDALGANVRMQDFADQSRAAIVEFIDQVELWEQDAITPAVSRLAERGGRLVLEADGLPATDIATLQVIARRLSLAEGLTAEQVAMLADADMHPLLKVEAMREATAGGGITLSNRERMVLDRAPTLEGAYRSLVDQARGEDVPVTQEVIAEITQQAADHADALTSLRQQLHGLADVVARDPRQPVTPEVHGFFERARRLGQRTAARGAIVVPNWRSVGLTRTGVHRALVASDVQTQRVGLTRTAQETARVAEEAERRLRDFTERQKPKYDYEDFDWAPVDERRYTLKGQAQSVSRMLNEQTGEAHSFRKLMPGTDENPATTPRWVVERGTLRERPAEAAPAAAPEPEPARAVSGEVIEPPRDALGPEAEAALRASEATQQAERDRVFLEEVADPRGQLSEEARLLLDIEWHQDGGAVADADRLYDEGHQRYGLEALEAAEKELAAWHEAHPGWTAEGGPTPAEPPAPPAPRLDPAEQARRARDEAAAAAERERTLAADAARTMYQSQALALPGAYLRLPSDEGVRIRWTAPDGSLHVGDGADLPAALESAQQKWREWVGAGRLANDASLRQPQQPGDRSAEAKAARRGEVPPEPEPGLFDEDPQAIQNDLIDAAPSKTEIDAFLETLDKNQKGAQEYANRPRELDKLVNNAQRELDTKTGANETTRRRMKRELDAALARRRQVDMAQVEKMGKAARVIEAMRWAIGSGRWESGLIAALSRMDNERTIGWIYKAIEDTKGTSDMGVISRWFLEQRDAIIADAKRLPDAEPAPEAARPARAEGRPTYLGEKAELEVGDAVVIEGTKHRVQRIDDDGTIHVALAGSNWKQRTIATSFGAETTLTWDSTAAVWRPTTVAAVTEAAALEALPPQTLDVLDPQTGARIPAQVRLVDADGRLVASGDTAYPPNLQPRSRDARGASEEQILRIAQAPDPKRLLGTAETRDGMPIVTTDGAVLSGNGRVHGVRQATDEAFAEARAATIEEARRLGFDENALDAAERMKRPMLVREVDLPYTDQVRWAWQLNDLPVGDLAIALAGAVEPAELARLRIVSGEALDDALRADKNAEAVTRILADHLPPDTVGKYTDSKVGLSDSGLALVKGALLARVLGAHDRARPTYESARAVVLAIIESADDDIKRIENGLGASLPELFRITKLAEEGYATAQNVAPLGEDIAKAVWYILQKRRADATFADIKADLTAVGGLFDDQAVEQVELQPLTAIQNHLALVLASADSVGEVRAFLAGVADALDPVGAAAEGFGLVEVTSIGEGYLGALNEGVRRYNEVRSAKIERRGVGAIDPFPSPEAPFDTPISPPRVTADGIDAPPVLKSRPVAPEDVAGEIEARMGPEGVATVESLADLDNLPPGYEPRFTDPHDQAVYDFLATGAANVALELKSAMDAFWPVGLSGRSSATTRKGATTRAQRAGFDSVVERLNRGEEVPPAELFIARYFAGDAFAPFRKTPDGRYNPRFVETGNAAAGDLNMIIQLGVEGRGRTRPPLVEGTPVARQPAETPEEWVAFNEQFGRRVLTPDEANAFESDRDIPTMKLITKDGTLIMVDPAAFEQVHGRPPSVMPKGTARPVVRVPREQRPIDADQLEADTGIPEAELDAARATEAAAIAQSSAHQTVVSQNPSLDRQVRRATGAPPVAQTVRTVLEFNKPDDAKLAERLRDEANAARARADAAQKSLDTFEANPPEPSYVDRPSAFPDPELRDMWYRLMRSWDSLEQVMAERGIAGAGEIEPKSLGEVLDAVESIDRGHFEPLTRDEALRLRTYLMTLANAELEGALKQADLAGAQRRLAGPVASEADLPEINERAVEILQAVESAVVDDPTLPPMPEFTGTRYRLTTPRTRSRGVGAERLSPRLVLTDRMASARRMVGPDGDRVVPQLAEELASGRMLTAEARIARGRVVNLLDRVFGPREERELRQQARQHFEDGLLEWVDPDVDDAKLVQKVAVLAYRYWIDDMATKKVWGNFNVYRRIDLMGPETLNMHFERAVRDIYKLGHESEVTFPGWYGRMTEAGATPFELWRKADNRIRNWARDNHPTLSQSVEALYGGPIGRRAATAGHNALIYTIVRFFADFRWLGLEYIEPMMLATGRSGPVVTASAVRGPFGVGRALTAPIRAAGGVKGAEPAPAAFGRQQMREQIRHFAWWSAQFNDFEQATAGRWRYLLYSLQNEQRRPFAEAVHSMLDTDPQVKRLMDDLGVRNVDEFIETLERDWNTLEASEVKLTGDEAARVFSPWLRKGIISEAEYKAMVGSGSYITHPAIEAELARVAGDPVAEALVGRLQAINQGLWSDLVQVYFGQTNRSNLQRVLNNPFLYWPISYQLKATRWMLRIMTDQAFGIDSRALPGQALQKVWDEHKRRLLEDPEYRAKLGQHATLIFIAGMLMPILPTDIGVSMSPWTRMRVDENYTRPFGIFGVGPWYTIPLVQRFLTEEGKPGGVFAPGEALAPIGIEAKRLLGVQSFQRDREAQSEIEAERRRIGVEEAQLSLEDIDERLP